MPSPAITLSRVSASTPDGRSLFTNLDLSFGPRRTGLVGRNGTGKTTLLRLIAGEATPRSGSIAVTGSIGVLRQQIQAGPTVSVADYLGIAASLDRLRRLESGAGSVADSGEADWSLPARYATALAEFGLAGLAPERPVATLSGGQRTRLGLAGLRLTPPDMLLLDEPTNNLDAEGRAAIAGLLARWRGGAIVVSHDRALLMEMDVIVELTSLGATSYGGNWEHYRARKALELAAVEQGLAVAERQLTEVARRTQEQAERQQRKDSTGRQRRAKGGQPRILAGAMQRRAEASAGDNVRLADRLTGQATDAAATARARVEVLQPLTVALAPTGLAPGRRVLEAQGLAGGPGTPPPIRDFSLLLAGPARVAISGRNGAGKTTLLRLLTGDLPPLAGNARIFVTHALLDQSVGLLDPAATIRDNYRRRHPGDSENACRAALARFKFRADAALQIAGSLSGGEMLRAGLALTIGATVPPELLILDEPTNHLDLDAIEAMEAGLRAYDGALLVVSHDRNFLDAIGIEREITLPGPS